MGSVITPRRVELYAVFTKTRTGNIGACECLISGLGNRFAFKLKAAHNPTILNLSTPVGGSMVNLVVCQLQRSQEEEEEDFFYF